jgi:hypothetical protein
MFKILKWINNNGEELETVMEDSKLPKVITELEKRGYTYEKSDFS